jgi:hypothetical protein
MVKMPWKEYPWLKNGSALSKNFGGEFVGGNKNGKEMGRVITR